MSDTCKTIVDVREVAPRDRHPTIFGAFDALDPGEALLLVNDHDPKPLYHQFASQTPDAFSWTYVEQGPDVWQVRIAKTAPTKAPVGTCNCKH